MNQFNQHTTQEDSTRAAASTLQRRKQGHSQPQSLQLMDQREDGGIGSAGTTGLLQRVMQLKHYSSAVVQLQSLIQADPIQRQSEELTQRMASAETAVVEEARTVQRQPNNTGLPDNLKSGMENLSGMSLDHVRVHYNSSKPAAVQAHAYAQGSDIHLASGQEKHLPHELGHVVQQARGEVKPTMEVGGMPVNDNPALESAATAMGNKALSLGS